jgi:hypothetical protein
MNTPNDHDDLIARRARAGFEAACADLDPATANRLRIARRAALAGPQAPRPWLVPVGGAIALALAAWLMWPRDPGIASAPVVATPPAPAPTAPRPDDATPDTPVVVVPPVAPSTDNVEAPPEDLLADEPLADDEPAWDELDDEDAELYAWLADAPVAPDTEADSL